METDTTDRIISILKFSFKSILLYYIYKNNGIPISFFVLCVYVQDYLNFTKWKHQINSNKELEILLTQITKWRNSIDNYINKHK